MRSDLLCLGLLTTLLCACAPGMQAPVLVRPVAQPMIQPAAPEFRTSMSGLIGEEVELSGIYSSSRSGALLLLRSGEQLTLSDAAGRPLLQLPGLENRSSVRIRGRLLGGQSQLGLSIRQVVRI